VEEAHVKGTASAMHKLSGAWTHQGIEFASVRSEQYTLVCPYS